MFHVNKNGVKIHTTIDGVDIALKDMSDRHLLNLLNIMRKKAAEGILLRWGCLDCDGVDYVEEMIFGDEALRTINYFDYLDELNSRKCLN
jgi:hypothetical protein